MIYYSYQKSFRGGIHMNIKQQKLVKKFLFEEFGQEKGSKVFLKIMRTTDLQEST